MFDQSLIIGPDGLPNDNRPLLTAPGGGVSVAGTTPTDVSPVRSHFFGYLQRLEAVCLVAGAAAGHWDLENDDGVLDVLQQPVNPSVVGTRLIWEFPTPLPSTVGGALFVTPSVNMGTWFFTANGFFAPFGRVA